MILNYRNEDGKWRLVVMDNGTVNPRPSTKRGWRRHFNKSTVAQTRALKIWKRVASPNLVVAINDYFDAKNIGQEILTDFVDGGKVPSTMAG